MLVEDLTRDDTRYVSEFPLPSECDIVLRETRDKRQDKKRKKERKKKKVHSATTGEETPHDQGSQKENCLFRPDPPGTGFSLGFNSSIS